MRKFGPAKIHDVLNAAKWEFISDPKALHHVVFPFKGNPVIAFFDPLENEPGWIVTSFKFVYSRCVMEYVLGVDYDYSEGYFDDYSVCTPVD